MYKLVHGFVFVLTVRLSVGLNCANKTCLNIPLTDQLEAPLTAKLDISGLNKQIVKLIEHEVEDTFTKLVDNITNQRMTSIKEKLTTEVHNSIALNVRGLNDTFEQLSSRLQDIFKWHSSQLEDKIEQLSSGLEERFKKFSTDLENRVARSNQQVLQKLETAGAKMQNNWEIRFSQILADMKTQKLETTTTTAGLLAKIAEANKQVAVTSCATQEIRNAGDIVVFPDTKTTTGIKDISSFTSSGKFTCETEGLYLVMGTLLAHEIKYSIYKNDQKVVSVIDDPRNEDDSSTAVAAVVLSKGDIVYVKTEKSFLLHGTQSSTCITIIKIK